MTVEANAEVARYQDRQGAVLRRNERMAWLDHSVPEDELLVPPPARIFDVEQITGSDSAQRILAF